MLARARHRARAARGRARQQRRLPAAVLHRAPASRCWASIRPRTSRRSRANAASRRSTSSSASSWPHAVVGRTRPGRSDRRQQRARARSRHQRLRRRHRALARARTASSRSSFRICCSLIEGVPVRYDLSRAFLVSLGPRARAAVRAPRPGDLRRRGAPDARRLAAHLRRARRRAAGRAERRRAAGEGTRVGLDRIDDLSGVRRAGDARQARLPRISHRGARAPASRSPVTARRPKRRRCSTTPARGRTSSASSPTRARTNRAG